MVDAFINSHEQGTVSRDGSGVALFEAEEKIFDIIEDIPGGCLVSCEQEKAFPDFLEVMGAMPAEMEKGSWRPIAQNDQNIWSNHQIATNEQNIRFENMRKAA